MCATQIDPQLLAIYQHSDYRVSVAGQNDFLLKPGFPSPELLGVYQRYSVSSACFISAYNPRSEPRSQDENAAAQQALIQAVETMGYAFLHGMGEDSEGGCAGEPCLLILGISRDQSLNLGTRFEQNALLWMEADAIVQLLLLR